MEKKWTFDPKTEVLRNRGTGRQYLPSQYERAWSSPIRGFQIRHGPDVWVNEWDVEFISGEKIDAPAVTARSEPGPRKWQCAACNRELHPELVDPGQQARVALIQQGQLLPLRCEKCDLISCHECIAETDSQGVSRVNMDCKSCGRRLAIFGFAKHQDRQEKNPTPEQHTPEDKQQTPPPTPPRQAPAQLQEFVEWASREFGFGGPWIDKMLDFGIDRGLQLTAYKIAEDCQEWGMNAMSGPRVLKMYASRRR